MGSNLEFSANMISGEINEHIHSDINDVTIFSYK